MSNAKVWSLKYDCYLSSSLVMSHFHGNYNKPETDFRSQAAKVLLWPFAGGEIPYWASRHVWKSH